MQSNFYKIYKFNFRQFVNANKAMFANKTFDEMNNNLDDLIKL